MVKYSRWSCHGIIPLMPERSTYNILQATNNLKPFILGISLQKPQKWSKNNHTNTKFLWFLQSQNHMYEKELWQHQLLSVVCQVFSREGSGTAALMRTAEFTLFNGAALPKPCRHFQPVQGTAQHHQLHFSKCFPWNICTRVSLRAGVQWFRTIQQQFVCNQLKPFFSIIHPFSELTQPFL